MIKFFKNIPGKLGGLFDDVVKFFKGILPETSKALGKLFTDLADILKLSNLKTIFDNAIKNLGTAFDDVVKLIKESNLFKAFGSLIDELKLLPGGISTGIRTAINSFADSIKNLDLVKDLSKLSDAVGLKLTSIADAVGLKFAGIIDSIKGLDLVKDLSRLSDAVGLKFIEIGDVFDSKFTAISDAIKASPITKVAGTIADDLADLGKAFVADIRGKVVAGGDAPVPEKSPVPEKPGFLMTPEERIRAKPQYIPPALPEAGILDEGGTLSKLKNIIPEGIMKFIDTIGDALGKVFGVIKTIGSTISEGASGLGKFLSSITDLDVMFKVVKKFVGVLPIVGWVFTTIDGLIAAFDTAGIAESLGKAAEDVTLGDRLSGFVGGFFGSFFGIVDFFGKMMGMDSNLQETVTSSITKLTSDLAAQIGDFFKFVGSVLTSPFMLDVYSVVGKIGGILFDQIAGALKGTLELIIGILTFNPEKIMGGIKNLYNTFLNTFTDTFQLIGSLLKSPIAKLINIIINAFEQSINYFIDGYNALVAKIPGIGKDLKFEKVAFTRMNEQAEPTDRDKRKTAEAAATTRTAVAQNDPRRVNGPAVAEPVPKASAVTPSAKATTVMAPVPGKNIPGESSLGGQSKEPPLSVRNNNPGNLKWNPKFTKKGYVLEGATEGEKGFAKFPTPEAGMAAMKKQIYIDTQNKGMTLSEFINKYAPSSDRNDTDLYIRQMAASLGIGPNDKIPKDKLGALQSAMIQKEGGQIASSHYGAPANLKAPAAAATVAGGGINRQSLQEYNGQVASATATTPVAGGGGINRQSLQEYNGQVASATATTPVAGGVNRQSLQRYNDLLKEDAGAPTGTLTDPIVVVSTDSEAIAKVDAAIVTSLQDQKLTLHQIADDISLSGLKMSNSTLIGSDSTDIRAPTGTSERPISVEFSPELAKAIDDEDARAGKAMKALLDASNSRDEFEKLRHKENLDLAIKHHKEIVDARKTENEKYNKERAGLYNQFNQTTKSIYENALKTALGNVGVTGASSFVSGGSSIIDKYLGGAFKDLGEKLFGKQQGDGMGKIFQSLLGSYANQTVNQVIAPALGMPPELLNRALNNFAGGNTKEAYADMVFGMSGVAIDDRTFLESITGQKGVDNAISKFSQTLADISTGPLKGLFTAASDGMGMYKVTADMDPSLAGSAMGANLIFEASKGAGRIQLEAAAAAASVIVSGASTAAKIDETSAQNSAKIRGRDGETQPKGMVGEIFDSVKEMFGFKSKSVSSGTGSGGKYNATDYEDWYSNPANAGKTPPWETSSSGGSKLGSMLANYAGYAGGNAIGRAFGVNTSSAGGAFAQMGINKYTGNLINDFMSGGVDKAGSGLISSVQDLYSALQGGVGNSMGTQGMNLMQMLMPGGASGTMGQMGFDFFSGMGSSSYFGSNLASAAGFMPGPGFEGMSGSQIAGNALGAIGTAYGTYQLSKGLSGGYELGGVNEIAALASFIPGVGMLAAPVGAIVNRLFGMKAPEVVGQGITGTLKTEKMGGAALQNFEDIHEKGGAYRSDKNYTQYSAADTELVKALQKVVEDTTKNIEISSKALSLDNSAFKNFTKDVKVDLKGLTPEQQKKALVDMLTQYSEDMLMSVYPEVSKYRKDIEGKMETNVEAFQRLAVATSVADNAFRMLGYSAAEITDVLGFAVGDTGSKFKAADVKSTMVDAFGGAQKMSSTLSNYLGQVYSPEKLAKIKLEMAKYSLGETAAKTPGLEKEAEKGGLLDVTKYGNVEDARKAHADAFDAAMKAGDFKKANALAESYNTFIGAVRLGIQDKARTDLGTGAGGAAGAYVDDTIINPGNSSVMAEDQSIGNYVPVSYTLAAVGGSAQEGEVDMNPVVAGGGTIVGGTGAVGDGTVGIPTPVPNANGGVSTNTTIVDNSSVISSSPTAINVMKDDSVRDYHPILGSSNRGLSGGYGWGNDYQGSFGAG